MPTIRYHGPFAEVDIPLVGQLVRRGDEFEATEQQAELLLAQPDNYELAAEPVADPDPEPVAVPKKSGARRQSPEDKS